MKLNLKELSPTERNNGAKRTCCILGKDEGRMNYGEIYSCRFFSHSFSSPVYLLLLLIAVVVVAVASLKSCNFSSANLNALTRRLISLSYVNKHFTNFHCHQRRCTFAELYELINFFSVR